MIADKRYVNRVRCEPGWRLDITWSQRLADHDLWYVWAGKGRMQLRDGRHITLVPGRCLWARPGGLYLGEQDPENRLGVTSVHFDPPAWLEVPSWEVFEFIDPIYADAALSRIVALTHHNLTTVATALLDALLLDITRGDCVRSGSLSGTARHHHEKIHNAASQIRENPADDLAIARLARQAGYSPAHFSRIFKQVVGVSPQTYQIEQRINRAQFFLRESAMTIGQIAEMLGYDSQQFFCRQFKEKTGLTPSRYRCRQA